MNWTVNDVIQWIEKANEKIQTNKQYLTQLDQAVGDGDHGINMSRGFRILVEKLQDTEYTSVTQALKDVAMTIISNVGGAAGPLYGTAFLRFSLVTDNKKELDETTLSKGMVAAVSGMKQRGRAAVGEKTLIDVWEPVAVYMEEAEMIAPDQIIKIAEQAMESTKEIKATKGRAAYLKDRSIGHIDPGAMSSYYILTAFAEVLQGADAS